MKRVAVLLVIVVCDVSIVLSAPPTDTPRLSVESAVSDDFRLDGIPYEQIPSRFRKVALIHELMIRIKNDKSKDDNHVHRLRSDLTGYCRTDECVKLMSEYDTWLQQNGGGEPIGRWG